jgi:tetratricopeptide (TPR) repeat protein
MENHPFFMSKPPEDAENLPASVEAIRQLKWDPEDGPREKALKFKDEGNLYFKVKNYKNAVASYTLGIKENPVDEHELMSVLHSNRAASHFYIQNYRSALNDCIFARKFNKNNLKPVHKGAECLFELKNYTDCIQWCDMGLVGMKTKTNKTLLVSIHIYLYESVVSF